MLVSYENHSPITSLRVKAGAGAVSGTQRVKSGISFVHLHYGSGLRALPPSVASLCGLGHRLARSSPPDMFTSIFIYSFPASFCK